MDKLTRIRKGDTDYEEFIDVAKEIEQLCSAFGRRVTQSTSDAVELFQHATRVKPK